MDNCSPENPHHFHIPVMGTGFSIDTPLKVARFGISSVISLVDDVLMEQMRQYHLEKEGHTFTPIDDQQEDFRAKRITAYLEYLDESVRKQLVKLTQENFSPQSPLTTYFELLPDSPLRSAYQAMQREADPAKKVTLQKQLRQQVKPGSIDVNIMTKLDRDRYVNGEIQSPEQADAMSALRGFASSSLHSSIIFSAGFNQRLYGYLSKFDDFFPDTTGLIKKKIILKVSDYRSALIQGKYLAKRGLWVSEYRIESGLNCGGHAFMTDGYLMGPILEEFKRNREKLSESLFTIYDKALKAAEKRSVATPPSTRITVQGGIGTADENNYLMERYGLDGTGWGTPFLLVPEVTNVDDEHLAKLAKAGTDDVFLSNRSPLGVPFWSLADTASEITRRKRLDNNKPGSPCPKGYLVSNTEFTKVPICHASRVYQKKKLKSLDTSVECTESRERQIDNVVAKSCICHDLAGGATFKLQIDKQARPAVCCGPNITGFSKISTLEEMVGHIYGRLSLLTDNERPHMFIRELSLYVASFRKEVKEASLGLLDKTSKNFEPFKNNLLEAVDYYRDLANDFSSEQQQRFLSQLEKLVEELDQIFPGPLTSITRSVMPLKKSI